MVQDQLYHPPHITVDPDAQDDGRLALVHHFEGQPLVQEFIHNTLLGLEYLWGDKVTLETTEVKSISQPESPQQTLPGMAPGAAPEQQEPEIEWQRVRYVMKNRKLSKGVV